MKRIFNALINALANAKQWAQREPIKRGNTVSLNLSITVLASTFFTTLLATQTSLAAANVATFDAPQLLSSNDLTGRAVAIADMNNDTHKDIVFVSGGHFNGANFIYFNDGAGGFSDSNRLQFGNNEPFTGSEDVRVSDLNNDNYPEILVGNSLVKGKTLVGQDVESYLYKNVGGTSIDLVKTFKTTIDGVRSVLFADIDGDNDQDIMMGTAAKPYSTTNTKTILFYENTGDFSFPVVDITLPHLDTGRNQTLVTVALATVDVNGVVGGTGRVKYLVAGNRGHWERLNKKGRVPTNSNYHPSAVFENTSSGAAAFSLKSSFGKVFQTTGIALGDIDGDGYWDIATGHGGEPRSVGGMNYVYINSGSNTFNDDYNKNIPIGTDAESSRPAAIADMNNDNKNDIVIGNQGDYKGPDQSYLYYYNTSTPSTPYTALLATPISQDYSQLRNIALDDLNNDQQIDIVGAVSCSEVNPNIQKPCEGLFVMLQTKIVQ